MLEYASTSLERTPHQDQLPAVGSCPADYKTTTSTSQMISRLGWQSLQHRRTMAKIVMKYRVTHHLIDMFLHPASLVTTDHTMRYLVPYCRTDVYLYSTFSSGIRQWNQLPDCTVTSPTLETFKEGLATPDIYALNTNVSLS